MFSKEFILVLVFIPLFKFSDEYHFSEPDLNNTLIPKKWRERCGHRFDPFKMPGASRCLIRLIGEEKYYNRSIRSVRTDFEITNRVFRGRNVKPRESPWTIQIGKKHFDHWGIWRGGWKPSCTGSLITMRHILTAAHCVQSKSELILFGGEDRVMSHVWSTDLFDVHQYKNYTPFKMDLDIAVIELHSRVDYDYHGWDLMNFNTICLPLKENWADHGQSDPISNEAQKATFYGWGETERGLPPFLQRANVEVKYGEMIGTSSNSFFVTQRSSNRTRACAGDSGSGLVQYLNDREERAVLIGIYTLNFPTNNCNEDYEEFSAFVRVVPHLHFIYEVLRKTFRREDYD